MSYSSPSAVKVAPRSFNSPGEACTSCSKRVYAAERTTGPGSLPYHKACLKCVGTCNKTLASGSFVEHDGQPYCRPCHSKAFGPKGFGFGGSMGGDYVDRYSPKEKPRSPSIAPNSASPRSSADVLADAQAAINSPTRRLTLDDSPSKRNGSPLKDSFTVAVNRPEEPIKQPKLMERTGSASSNGDAKTFSVGGAPDRCRRCNDVVYFAEQTIAAGNKWHKRCLRCASCSKSLDSHLKVSDNLPYCSKCHAEKSGIAEQGFSMRPSMF